MPILTATTTHTYNVDCSTKQLVKLKHAFTISFNQCMYIFKQCESSPVKPTFYTIPLFSLLPLEEGVYFLSPDQLFSNCIKYSLNACHYYISLSAMWNL